VAHRRRGFRGPCRFGRRARHGLQVHVREAFEVCAVSGVCIGRMQA
jgi:hypothetical protein